MLNVAKELIFNLNILYWNPRLFSHILQKTNNSVSNALRVKWFKVNSNSGRSIWICVSFCSNPYFTLKNAKLQERSWCRACLNKKMAFFKRSLEFFPQKFSRLCNGKRPKVKYLFLSHWLCYGDGSECFRCSERRFNKYLKLDERQAFSIHQICYGAYEFRFSWKCENEKNSVNRNENDVPIWNWF